MVALLGGHRAVPSPMARSWARRSLGWAWPRCSTMASASSLAPLPCPWRAGLVERPGLGDHRGRGRAARRGRGSLTATVCPDAVRRSPRPCALTLLAAHRGRVPLALLADGAVLAQVRDDDRRFLDAITATVVEDARPWRCSAGLTRPALRWRSAGARPGARRASSGRPWARSAAIASRASGQHFFGHFARWLLATLWRARFRLCF